MPISIWRIALVRVYTFDIWYDGFVYDFDS